MRTGEQVKNIAFVIKAKCVIFTNGNIVTMIFQSEKRDRHNINSSLSEPERAVPDPTRPEKFVLTTGYTNILNNYKILNNLF